MVKTIKHILLTTVLTLSFFSHSQENKFEKAKNAYSEFEALKLQDVNMASKALLQAQRYIDVYLVSQPNDLRGLSLKSLIYYQLFDISCSTSLLSTSQNYTRAELIALAAQAKKTQLDLLSEGELKSRVYKDVTATINMWQFLGELNLEKLKTSSAICQLIPVVNFREIIGVPDTTIRFITGRAFFLDKQPDTARYYFDKSYSHNECRREALLYGWYSLFLQYGDSVGLMNLDTTLAVFLNESVNKFLHYYLGNPDTVVDSTSISERDYSILFRIGCDLKMIKEEELALKTLELSALSEGFSDTSWFEISDIYFTRASKQYGKLKKMEQAAWGYEKEKDKLQQLLETSEEFLNHAISQKPDNINYLNRLFSIYNYLDQPDKKKLIEQRIETLKAEKN